MPLSTLFWHLDSDQDKAIRKFLQGSDVFVSLPTGEGKSLCFAALPGVQVSACFLISSSLACTSSAAGVAENAKLILLQMSPKTTCLRHC